VVSCQYNMSTNLADGDGVAPSPPASSAIADASDEKTVPECVADVQFWDSLFLCHRAQI